MRQALLTASLQCLSEPEHCHQKQCHQKNSGPSKRLLSHLKLPPHLQLYHSDIWQIPVFLRIVKSVAHHKFIRNREAGIIHLDLFLHPPLRLIEQCAQADTGRLPLPQHLNQVRKRSAGIDNILYNQHILILQRFIQILDNADNTA